VQRQGAASGGVPMNPTNSAPSGDLSPTTNGGFTTPSGTPPAPPQNVIPRQGITTLPAPLGDIAPVQPDLVRPDPAPPVTDDPELESIPALW
jgi:hypothetical protein